MSRSTAADIRQFLQDLAKQDWIRRSERRWWPHFLFHYTDIRNAVRILQDGTLYSRLQAEQMGRMAISSGSPDVLAGTSLHIQDCVRLYFRPKTPTQYHAEGVHSAQSLARSRFPNAHCPVPVFFLFDAAAILSRPDTQFSDRGLGGADYRLGSTLDDLKALPWQQIYHQGRIDPEVSREIIARRNAEVIVPQQLDLNDLRFIYCRSDAEKDTLLHLLPPALRRRYQSKIVASNRSELFFRQRTFIENATLLADRIYLRFSPDTTCPGPFHLRLDLTTSRTWTQERTDFTLGPSYEYNIQFKRPLSQYWVRVFLDDHLIYANVFEELEIPF
ncbi:MAG: DUF4433 domain-containing protein [Gammaproteobacteria bacterium]|nr:MAG: DUF4433 domain-containing protein [Gammaproteobacteria bacterium]